MTQKLLNVTKKKREYTQKTDAYSRVLYILVVKNGTI